MRPEPNAVSAERQLRASGEIYLGFPDVPPSINFLDALDIILKDGVGSPFSAKEIDALYVMYSRRNSKPCRAWVITLRGIPPLPVSIPPGASREIAEQVWGYNHIRTVINDETGKILLMTNWPQPDNIQK